MEKQEAPWSAKEDNQEYLLQTSWRSVRGRSLALPEPEVSLTGDLTVTRFCLKGKLVSGPALPQAA